MCFPGGGTHITRDMCFPGGGTHITRDMCFPGRGTHITRDKCFPGRGTHITRDMCVLGGGTHISIDMSFVSGETHITRDKTRLIFGTRQLLSRVSDMRVPFLYRELFPVSPVKDLVIILDSYLNFNYHINTLTSFSPVHVMSD